MLGGERGDGTCLLDSLRISLLANNGLVVSVEALQDTIMLHCQKNWKFLMQFWVGRDEDEGKPCTRDEFLGLVTEFFVDRQYNNQTGDNIPLLLSVALNLNITILQHSDVHCYMFRMDKPGAKLEAQLILHYNHQDQVQNHYSPLARAPSSSCPRRSFADVVAGQKKITDWVKVQRKGGDKKKEIKVEVKEEENQEEEQKNELQVQVKKEPEEPFNIAKVKIEEDDWTQVCSKARKSLGRKSVQSSSPITITSSPESSPKKKTPKKKKLQEVISLISDEEGTPMKRLRQKNNNNTPSSTSMDKKISTPRRQSTSPRKQKTPFQRILFSTPSTKRASLPSPGVSPLPSLSSPEEPPRHQDDGFADDPHEGSQESQLEEQEEAVSEYHPDTTMDSTDLSFISSQGSTASYIPRKEQGLNFGDPWPSHIFEDVPEEEVYICPDDIDGTKKYKIREVTKGTYYKFTGDGRFFELKTCQLKNSNNIRKIGWCMGHLQCPNDNCLFLLANENNMPNCHAFQVKTNSEGKFKACKTCGCRAERRPCGARKQVEFLSQENTAIVCHLGVHSCRPTTTRRELKAEMHDNLKAMEGVRVRPRQIQRERVLKAIKEGEWEEAGRQADLWEDTKAVENFQQETRQDQDPNSMEAVGRLKEGWDKKDTYYIYKAQDGRLNGGNSYVFKSSHWAADIMVKLSEGQPRNEFSGNPVFFDGSHSRIMGPWLSLGLWTYNHTNHKLIRLASMDVKSESTENISTFWSLVNSMLEDYTKMPTFRFHPTTIVTDEAGANFTSILKVFGIKTCEENIQTCLLHFKNSVNKMANKCAGHVSVKFKELAGELENVESVKAYKDVRAKLVKLAKKTEDTAMSNWVVWWDKRRGHLFKAFKGSVYSGSNLAEVGNSSWNRGRKLSLADAAYDDVTSLLIYQRSCKAYMEGRSTMTGKVPSAEQKSSKERSSQVRRAKDMANSLDDIEAIKLHAQEVMDPSAFIPAGNTKHRPGQKDLELGVKVRRRTTKKKKRNWDEGYSQVLLDQLSFELDQDSDELEEPQVKKRNTGKVTKKPTPSPPRSPPRSPHRSPSPVRPSSAASSLQSIQTPPTPHAMISPRAPDFMPSSVLFDLSKEWSDSDLEDTVEVVADMPQAGRKYKKTVSFGSQSQPETLSQGQAAAESYRLHRRRGPKPPTQQQIDDKLIEALMYMEGPVPARAEGIKPSHPPMVCISPGAGRCQGCHGKISFMDKQSNFNLVFEMMGMSNTTWVNSNYPNVWQSNKFHLKIQCLQRFNPTVEVRHLMIKDDTLVKLQGPHFEVLAEKHLLGYLLANRC